jgi:hypothetical protein
MKKQKLSLPILLGLLLIMASLCLMLYFQIRAQLGSRNAQQTFETLSQMLPDRTPGVPGGYVEAAMPVLEIHGSDYAALLEIPALGVKLPVADHWNSNRLSDSPVRFCGSVYDHTMVIGGADDPRQFGFCDEIDLGVTVTVTDMTGAEFTYTVSRVDRSSSAEASWLTEAEHDLTLFCRDQYSMEYLAVRCQFAFTEQSTE